MAKKKANKKPAEAGAKKRPWWKTTLKWAGLGLLGYEAYHALSLRRQKRRDTFNAALYRSQQTGKPIWVVGDPDGTITSRFLGRDYDCGALCIDPKGCLSCANYVTGRLEDELAKLPTGGAVVYVNTGVLESVEDMPRAVAELKRVSGGDLFVATVHPYTLTAYLWPGHKRRIFSTPPDRTLIEYKPLLLHPENGSRDTQQISLAGPRRRYY
jgi:hypothetical protein